MNLNDYQDAARRTAISLTPEHMAFGLLEEAGELAGIYKRLWRGDAQYRVRALDSDGLPSCSNYAFARIRAELGDVLWYVSMLAESHGFTLEDIAEDNLQKLQSRKERNVIQGAGDDR